MPATAKNKLTHWDFFNARDILRARGFRSVRAENDTTKPEFGSLWVHADGREFWLNYKTIGNLPD